MSSITLTSTKIKKDKNFSDLNSLLKVFNDATNTLSGIYYLTTNLFIIETLHIVGAFDEYMSQELELKPCTEVMKSKWLDYYVIIIFH